MKNAAPLDILKAFFGNIKTACTISLALEQLVDPVAKLFVKSSQKRNLMSHSDSKVIYLCNVKNMHMSEIKMTNKILIICNHGSLT